MLRVGSDTLPTPLNLQKIILDPGLLSLQSVSRTTGRNWSYQALEQDRYTWKQDSVLLRLVKSLEKALSNVQIYADLDI